MKPYAVMNVTLTFSEPALGTAPGSPLFEEKIATKRPEGVDPAEVNAVEEAIEELGIEEEEPVMTVFPREDGKPFIWDYQVKGFFKDACSMLRRSPGTKSAELRAHKKQIDGLVFITPRRLFLELPEGSELGIMDRPLRADTPKGERIALARSETAPAGTTIRFQIVLLRDLVEEVEEWLEYGALRGLLQWRNAGWGRFIAKIEA